MGADGGIRITKISEIKQYWKEIKTRLTNNFTSDLKGCADYERVWIENYLTCSKALPDNVDKLSSDDIVRLFGYLSSCDCPYLYEIPDNDLLITGEGDYVADQMNTLSHALRSLDDSTYVESWT